MSKPIHTLAGTLTQFIQILNTHNLDSPRLSAEVLLAHALQVSREDFLKQRILNPTTPLSPSAYSLALALLKRRIKGEPIAYLTGKKEFYGRPFEVTPATLIPRPETELLIDTALEFIQSTTTPLPKTFIDLGTGSGCIGITLALEAPHWRGLAIDNCAKALNIATKNAQNLQATTLDFARANFHTIALAPKSLGLFVSNPPYISSTEYDTLQHEVRLFEPLTALVPTPHYSIGQRNTTDEGNTTGEHNTTAQCTNALECKQPTVANGKSINSTMYQLPSTTTTQHTKSTASQPTNTGNNTNQMVGTEDIYHLISLAQKALYPNGLLIIEIGCSQGEYALAQVASSLWKNQKILQDLAGLDRLLVAKKT